MSSRFLLVPEDMYNGLLSSKNTSPKESINLSFAKEKLEGVKKAKRLNKSAKNVLYNQELRRVLQIHKEEKEKPVKVELADGSALVGRKGSPSLTHISSDGDDLSLANLSTIQQTPIASDVGGDDNTEDLLNRLAAIVEAQKSLFGVNANGQILQSGGRRNNKPIKEVVCETPYGQLLIRTPLKGIRQAQELLGADLPTIQRRAGC